MKLGDRAIAGLVGPKREPVILAHSKSRDLRGSLEFRIRSFSFLLASVGIKSAVTVDREGIDW
jgi:hypothetical protein